MCPDAEIRGSQTWKISISWGTSVQLLLWENSEGNGFWFFNFQLTGITDGKREMLWLDSDLSPSLVSGCGVGAVKTSQVVGCQWTSCPCSRALSVKVSSFNKLMLNMFLIKFNTFRLSDLRKSIDVIRYFTPLIKLYRSPIIINQDVNSFFLYFDTKRTITPGFHTCFFFPKARHTTASVSFSSPGTSKR